MQQIFYGKVEHGNLRLISQDQYEKLIKGLEGQSIKLVLGKRPKKRTLKQNAYYHGVVVKMIADHIGDDPDDVHEDLKEMFAPRRERKYIGADGKETTRMKPMSTTDLMTKQFSDDYVEKIKMWAAQFHNLYIPDPGEVQLDN